MTSTAAIARFRRTRAAVRAGASRYSRGTHLFRLVLDYDATPGADPVPWLKGKLAHERRKHRVGHYSYDLNYHLGLMQAWQAEIWAARAQPHRQAAE